MAIHAGPGYALTRSSGRCAATSREFAPGESYIAAMVERTDGQGPATLERWDCSREAWSGGARPAGEVLGTWRATFSPEAPARKALLGDDELLELFEDLGDAREGRRLAFRYLLALLLVRRRVLRLHSTGPGRITVTPRSAGEGAPIEVVDPGLDDASIADAVDQLGAILPQDPGGSASGGGS